MKTKLIILFAVVLIFAAGCSKSESMSEISFPSDFKTVILKYSKKNNLDPYLIYGLILKESRFMHDAVSSKGAKGLMQITDETAKWTANYIGMNNLSEKNIFDPAVNIELGCAYFSYLLEKYNNNEQVALCAYNAGMGKVGEWLDDPQISSDGKNIDNVPYAETKQYVEDIIAYSKRYMELYPNLASVQ